jgi:GNAT-family acetyltransferase (TIGR03103 family)
MSTHENGAHLRTHSRLERKTSATLQSWRTVKELEKSDVAPDVVIDCGWGRLIFAHTFSTNNKLVETLKNEKEQQRDIAFYVRDPHVLLANAPQELFLDPSHTYRMWLSQYRQQKSYSKAFSVRRIKKQKDVEDIIKIYKGLSLVPPAAEFLWKIKNSKKIIPLVLENLDTGEVLGTVMGVDHVEVFNDAEGGASLWALAIDPKAPLPGLGEALTRYLIEYFITRGRTFMDLSVLHNNKSAIALYEKLGFQRVPVFCVKRKNIINEQLYISNDEEAKLNPYAKIIINEARRRGIRIDIIDSKRAYFTLTHGSRSITCRESLTELTSAIAFSICDDKILTKRFLSRAGLNVPPERIAGTEKENKAFLEEHKRLVVKPVRGEQGRGITIDVSSYADLKKAILGAKEECENVFLEKYIEGTDLRIIVINFEFVAAATRKPAAITGDGKHTILDLIKKQSRRRMSATGGESKIPLDTETKRCVKKTGYSLDSILPTGEYLEVRKTANLHTGGTIHDVTDKVHPTIIKAACEAAKAINIPVTGLDFIVPKIDSEEYVIIEANERPGLENHQPQPTAERLIDLLFPETTY